MEIADISSSSEEISLNMDGWLSVVNTVSTSSSEVSPHIEVEVDQNNFTYLESLVAGVEKLESAINLYEEAVAQETANMQRAARNIQAQDQRDQTLFEQMG